MSTLKKAINLLQDMPERKLEAVYTYIQFVNTLEENEETTTNKKSASSIDRELPTSMLILNLYL